MRSLLKKLQAFLDKLDKVSGVRASGKNHAYPPASEAEIATMEKKLNFKFPPSYRSFLKIHNGWKYIRGSWSVLGVSGQGYASARRSVSLIENTAQKDLKRSSEAELKDREKNKKSGKVLDQWEHVAFAVEPDDSECLIFNRNKVDKNGEYEIISVAYGSYVRTKYKNFAKFLEKTLQNAKRDLADEIKEGRS